MKHLSLLLILVCASTGCARRSFDPITESALLLTRDAEWSAAASAGQDVEKVASYWTDDAVLMPPGEPAVEGKAALVRFVTDSFKIPGFKIQWTSETPTFSPDGGMAYMRATNQITLPGADGKPLTIRGRGVTVWRRDADGQWRCAVDIWNEPPPAAAK